MTEIPEAVLNAARAKEFERAFRIRVWNACKASNMKDDAAIQAVEKAVAEVERATLAQFAPGRKGDA